MLPAGSSGSMLSLPRADSTRLTGVQVAERLNVSASTWRSCVGPGQAQQRTDASTPAHRGGTAAPSTSGRRVVGAAAHEPLDVPYTARATRSSSCPVFAGSAQNPVDVIRELRCIQRRLSPAEVEALIADYE